MSRPAARVPVPRPGDAWLAFPVVTGVSMQPTLYAGDRLLVSFRRRPAIGDVVVARFPDGAVVVKRITERRADGWWLISDNPAAGTDPAAGVDSRHRGAIPDHDVLGVAVARLWPRPRRLRSGGGHPHAPSAR